MWEWRFNVGSRVFLWHIGGIWCSRAFFFFQAEDGIRDLLRSRGLGDVYKRQIRATSSPRNSSVVSRRGARRRERFASSTSQSARICGTLLTSASAAATIVFPVPPLPLTTASRIPGYGPYTHLTLPTLNAVSI